MYNIFPTILQLPISDLTAKASNAGPLHVIIDMVSYEPITFNQSPLTNHL